MCAERHTGKCVSANRQTDRRTEGIHTCVFVHAPVCVRERMSDQVVCSYSGRDERERNRKLLSWRQMDCHAVDTHTHTHTHTHRE